MKTVTVRAYVALLSLVAALLEFAAALVQLGTALLLRAAATVHPPTRLRIAPRPDQSARPARLRVVPQPDQNARLMMALTGMGWPAPAVRRFVDSLGDRASREPIETLIKEGLAHLAA
jgi:hypothetical protein